MSSRDNYRNGRKAEAAVARLIAREGCSGVSLAPGSRGPADVIADHCPFAPKGLAIQVKSTIRDGDPCARVKETDERRLRRFGRARRTATAFACVSRGGAIRFYSRLRRR